MRATHLLLLQIQIAFDLYCTSYFLQSPCSRLAPSTMNPDDMYAGREDLMTRNELEEFHHVPSSNEKIPSLVNDWILFGNYTNEVDRFGMPAMRPRPEAVSRRDFEGRPPALGATPEILNELRTHNAKLITGGVAQRMLFLIHYGMKCYDN